MVRSKKVLSLLLAAILVLSGCQYQLPTAGSSTAQAEKTIDVSDIDEQLVEEVNVNSSDTDSAESAMSTKSAAWDGTTTKEKYSVDGIDITFELQNTWEGGFVGNIKIENNSQSTITAWKLSFDYDGDFGSVWNVNQIRSGATYTFTPVDWNTDIAAGENREFGFTGTANFAGFPGTYRFSYDIVKDTGNTSKTTDITSDNKISDQTGGNNTTGSESSADNSQGNSSDVSNDNTSDETGDVSDGTAGDASGTSGGNQVSKHGRLKVKGRYIVDKNNKRYQIKGVSTHGVAWFPQYVNKSCFASFKKMGANTIRLACYSSTGEGYNTSSVWKTMDKGIKAASDLGMYVIVDWHILNNGNPKTDMKAAKKFFKRFAKKYGKKKNIIWEICNEPNGCNWSSDIKPYAKKMIKLIRKYSSNIIVVGTPTWSQDVDVVAQSPLTGSYKKNVCYTIHFYAATHGDNIRNKVKTAYKKKLPILCTEFSICDASGNGGLDKTSGKKWIKLLKKYKIGFIAWNISNKAESSSFIKPSVTKTGNFKKSNLTASGKWIVKQW